MAITKRLVKGSALTHTELDSNFTDLDGRVTTLESAPGSDSQTLTLAGDDLTITGGNTVSLSTLSTEVVDDTSPQLGGNLDLNGNQITGSGGSLIKEELNALSLVGGSNGIVMRTTTDAGITIGDQAGNVVLGNSANSVEFVNGVAVDFTNTNIDFTSATITGLSIVQGIDDLSDVDTSTTPPGVGQVLKWDGSEWAPAADSAGSSLGADAITTGMIAENVVTSREIAANTVAVGDLATDISIDFLADVDTTTVAPTDGQALVWDNANSIWEPGTISSGSSYADSDVDTHLNVSGASSGQILSWNGTDYAWVADQTGGGGGGTPGGSDTQVQYNNSGAFGAEADFTYNASTNTLTVVNLVATNITATGSGTQTISAGANIELDATNRVLVTDTPFRLASFTTTTRNAIASPVNGDMIYNTTTNQLESYENSSWVATAGSGSSYSDSDVDTHLNTSSATSGQVLSWNGSDYAWAADATGGATSINTAGNTGTGSVTFATETLTVTGTTNQINVDAAAWALSLSLDADLTGLTTINTHTIPSGTGTLALTSDIPADNTPTFAVTAPDSGRYRFDGAGTDSDDNATLYLYRGFTYKFAVNSSGHPFHIQTSSGAYNASNLYTDNVTNPGTQSGTITWTVQMDAPSTLYYVCQYHSAMAGTINIV